MFTFGTPAFNAVLIFCIIVMLGMGVPILLMWLNAKTKQFTELAEIAKHQAMECKILSNKNEDIIHRVEQQAHLIDSRMDVIEEFIDLFKNKVNASDREDPHRSC